MLFAVDPDYPAGQRFKVRQHTVEAVSDMVSRLAVPPDDSMIAAPQEVRTALGVFLGYAMLDAWIANQDRHHENWAAIWDGKDMRLAPTFDHGAALARNLTDSEREERLKTKDQNRTIAAFAGRGRSALYASAADSRPLGLREAFLALTQRAPDAASLWLAKLRAVTRESVSTILERVPSARMSSVCRQFTLNLLTTNQQRLLEQEIPT
jgi:hypothetical protein